MPSKVFSIRPAKFLTTFFYQLSNFMTIRSLDAPSRAASCPGNGIFLFIFAIYLHFLTKTGPLDAPRVDARAVAPSAPPLHATATTTPGPGAAYPLTSSLRAWLYGFIKIENVEGVK